METESKPSQSLIRIKAKYLKIAIVIFILLMLVLLDYIFIVRKTRFGADQWNFNASAS